MYKGYAQFTRKHDVHRALLLGGCLLLCLLLARTLSAAPLVLSAGDEVRVANASLSWLRDPAHALQPSPELLSAPGWMENASGRVPSFGFTQDQVWLRLRVDVP
ncbi:MAG: hypothetical protein LPK85_10395, partial [Gammaproteobacteria bacterium]|nr:hypothetical protein [Gammaproteobacteria bacterium]